MLLQHLQALRGKTTTNIDACKDTARLAIIYNSKTLLSTKLKGLCIKIINTNCV